MLNYYPCGRGLGSKIFYIPSDGTHNREVERGVEVGMEGMARCYRVLYRARLSEAHTQAPAHLLRRSAGPEVLQLGYRV